MKLKNIQKCKINKKHVIPHLEDQKFMNEVGSVKNRE